MCSIAITVAEEEQRVAAAAIRLAEDVEIERLVVHGHHVAVLVHLAQEHGVELGRRRRLGR